MAFRKTPSYLYRKAAGSPFYLKLPIPPALRHHFPNAKGKPRTHVVEALGTAKEADAEQLKRPRLSHYWTAFDRLLRGAPRAKIALQRERIQTLRAALAESQDGGDEDTTDQKVQGAIKAHFEAIEEQQGREAAKAALGMAAQTKRHTLLDALKEWNAGDDVRDSTKGKRMQTVKELVGFLRVPDCLPAFVTDANAVAYVGWLNAGALGYSTKQDRLSTLSAMWRYLERRREVPGNANPWGNHEVTKKSTGKAPTKAAVEKRGWHEAEVLKLFSAPDTNSAHYKRALFRELYALGFISGMRLDEIVSLRPEVIEAIVRPKAKGAVGYWLRIEASKTGAGVRTIPVVHPAAVAILTVRLALQKEPTASLFPECRPGGPDNKLSWHVQKALGRDRHRLGFGPEVDFHSARRTFMSMMENSGADVVHVQRYVGHRVPTLMHSVYSDGASRESLLKVARAVKYNPKVEVVLAEAVTAA